MVSGAGLPPPCRTKVIAQSLLITAAIHRTHFRKMNSCQLEVHQRQSLILFSKLDRHISVTTAAKNE